MTRLIPVFGLLVGCGFDMSMGSPDARPADAAPGVDAEIDAPTIDAPDLCIGKGANQVCFAALPTTPRVYAGNTTIDTSASGTCTPTTNSSAANWCVIDGTRIDVQSGVIVRAIGDKPVVFAATEEIIVVGVIDVGSRATVIGAGGNASACTAGTAATEGNSSGGGYGGSFGGRGANGEGNDGGSGGVSPVATPNTTVLRGGCAGGAGGPMSGVVAAGGAGGGAMALLSRTMITLTNGALNASGAGGHVGELVRQGSGGGGSGGMIVLDAPAITAQGASVFANGGGGGEGNDLVFVGLAGAEPLSPTNAGVGGAGMSAGGDGGAGSLGAYGGMPPMNASSSNAGGGGGGGGAGVIITSRALSGADVSPVPLGTPPI